MCIITRNPPPKATPWGKWDHAREYAPGIVFVSTSSHGGYHLDAERRKEAWSRIGKMPTWGGTQTWLEEDCDAVLVYLIWPEYASDEQIAAAVNTVFWMIKGGNDAWKGIQAWWGDRAPERQI